MQDTKQRLEKLLTDAEECQLICELATNHAKRAAFQKLAHEYRQMAADLEVLIASGTIVGDLGI